MGEHLREGTRPPSQKAAAHWSRRIRAPPSSVLPSLLGKSYPLWHQLEPSLPLNAALSGGTLEGSSGRQAIPHLPLAARELAQRSHFDLSSAPDSLPTWGRRKPGQRWDPLLNKGRRNSAAKSHSLWLLSIHSCYSVPHPNTCGPPKGPTPGHLSWRHCVLSRVFPSGAQEGSS